MAAYQGHPSRAAWNVSLWIGNDEGLYNMAREYIRRSATKDQAAQRMFEALTDIRVTHTPDGVAYSVSNIRHALKGL